MISSENVGLERLVIHKTGNKSREEGIKFSKSPIKLSEAVKDLLIRYFLSPFGRNEYFHLHHEADLNLNEIYHFACAIFDDPGSFYLNSVNMANHLYENSLHPKIREGEFYVAYFKNLIIDGEETDALGLFKSESRETFLKIYPTADNFNIEHEDGININKSDKGCLIFNIERESGFVVATVDNLSKGSDALYWTDSFLKIKQRNDEYFQTSQTLNLCKEFVTNKLPGVFEIDRPGQAELLNKSMKFFRENDSFVMEEFVSEVFAEPEMIETFNEYKRDFEIEREVKIDNDFDISGQAVKRLSRVYKSIIKLDKNFHIYVHGNRENIEKGFDEERGMAFYRLFYKEES